MVKKGVGNFVIKLLIVVLIIVFQLLGTYYNLEFRHLFENLIYGWESTRALLFTVLFGTISGIGCVYLVHRQPNGEIENSKAANTGAIILLCVAVLALALKFVMGTAFWLIPFSVLRPGWSELFYWTIESQVPSLLLGLAVGGLIIK
ncbi:MAG: hypothetical protein H0S79_05565 [Anaerolineaceae bacterium]|nr:hypothetical protein [Anaerolineaceae bacterium]